ncbi:hypothetical protein Ae201684_019054 [Aphanomyces euteiches]|uniref:AMP-dependent synthetase/ligase domain-containing protein n=1 Tax=Aphanomyces euteiches TaxID=100861 RepID=A0A6G0W3L7_9STRA|nr:hypothetical protein Ae201684_019054 [Aphanomyces euteiches]
MPVDATFPVKRLAYMLEDAAVAAIVTTKAYQSAVDPFSSSIPVVYADSSDLYVDVLRYDATKHCLATPESEAYIVYTSGSTGKPKGVPVLHRGAVNTVMHFPMPGIGKGVRAMQFMAIGFDNCQWEVWSTLSFGAPSSCENQMYSRPSIKSKC